MPIASNSSTINVTSLIDFRSVSEEGVGPERYAFGQPIRILSAQTLSEVMPLLDAVHRLSVEGLWCVGYVRYEAAPAFDAAMTTYPPTGPLAWFAVYDEALPWPQSEDEGAEIQPHLTWESSVTRRQFDEAITQVHHAIESGTVYQVNFTAPLHGRVEAAAGGQVEDSIQFFHALRRSQPHAYAAWINRRQSGATRPDRVEARCCLDPGCPAPGRHRLDRVSRAKAPSGRRARIPLIGVLWV